MNSLVKNKKVIIFLIKLTILIAIFYYIVTYQRVDFQNVWHTFQKAFSGSSGSLILLLFAILLLEYSQAPIVTILMSAYKVVLPVNQVYKINLISSFYTMFLPIGVYGGGIVRWYRLSQENKKRSEVFTVIAIQRILSILSLLFLGLIILIFQNPFEEEAKNIFIVSSAAALGFIILALVLMTHAPAIDFLDKRIAAPLLKKMPDFLKEKLEKLWAAVSGYKGEHKVLIYAFTLSLIYRIGAIAFFYLLATTIGIKISITIAALLYLGSSLIEFIPTIFAGLGFRELIFTYLYKFHGITQEQAVSHSLLIFFFIVLLSSIGGILEFKHHFIRKRI